MSTDWMDVYRGVNEPYRPSSPLNRPRSMTASTSATTLDVATIPYPTGLDVVRSADQPPPVKVRTRKEKTSRSRLGCLTCRKRHKKCDEDFTSSTGACNRCFTGSWECVKPIAPGQRPLKVFKHKRDLTTSNDQADQNEDQDLVGFVLQRTNNHRSPSASISPPAPQPPSLPPVRQVAPSVPLAAAISRLQQPPPSQPVPFEHPVVAPTSPSFAFPSLPTLSAAARTIEPFSPVVSMSTGAHGIPTGGGGGGEIDLGVGTDLDAFFQSLDAVAVGGSWEDDMLALVDDRRGDDARIEELTQEEQQQHTSPLDQLLAQQLMHKAPALMTSQPSVSTPPPGPDGESLDPEMGPFYDKWNEDFFRSVPQPVREIVTARMNNVAASSELTRCASMAMVLLYRVRSQANDMDNKGEEAREHLLAQSDRYFQQALAHLEKPVPLEAQMIAVLDLQAYQFDQWGAPASRAILLLGEYFVTEAFGPHPSLNLASLRDSSSMALRAFSYCDVLHCICVPRRRTLFTFTDSSNDASPSPLPSEIDRAIETHIGLPVGLLLCLAATCNLSAEMAGLSPEVIKTKAAVIEKAIKDWRPLTPDAAALADSTAYIDELSTAEMWRHTALLHHYQTIHHHGPLSLISRTCLTQLLQLGTRNPFRAASYISTRAFPWFLAATVATHAADREVCRAGLKSCGPQKGYRDNLEAIEKIWEEWDKEGWIRDWREVLNEKGLFVGVL